MSTFDRIVKNGSIAETLHPYSPTEREHDYYKEEDCAFCHDTMRIGDWRTYMKAFRVARLMAGRVWMKTATIEEILIICRDIRKGTRTLSGKIVHQEECPICWWR